MVAASFGFKPGLSAGASFTVCCNPASETAVLAAKLAAAGFGVVPLVDPLAILQ
jgi:hypothetical protein